MCQCLGEVVLFVHGILVMGVVARHSVNNMYGHCGTVVLTGCCVVCVSLELVLQRLNTSSQLIPSVVSKDLVVDSIIGSSNGCVLVVLSSKFMRHEALVGKGTPPINLTQSRPKPAEPGSILTL
jgi:hypothetical protein